MGTSPDASFNLNLQLLTGLLGTAKYLQIRARRNDHGLGSRVCRNLGSLEGPNRELVNTFSILTTTPNAVTSPVHDRMPVILIHMAVTCGSIRE
jgi:hypothetical protein